MTRQVRHIRARNRWHAAWLLVVETVLHPRTETVIRKSERQRDRDTLHQPCCVECSHA